MDPQTVYYAAMSLDGFIAEPEEKLEWLTAFEGPGYGPDTHFEIQQTTIAIQSLISIEGIRFVFSSFVSNFTGFSVVGVTFVALMGAGVAEAAGLMDSLIRKLVAVSPKRLLAFILILVGVLSSVASDAGYLILIPLGAAAFMSVGRHPLAGLAACFAPRQQIDTDHGGSNLRIARPHATISEGASTISFFGCTCGDNCMLANGLATRVLTWEREPTMSSRPGITADPPVSRMCSMLLYWVEVKKNCIARCTSSARFSRNGRRISAS